MSENYKGTVMREDDVTGGDDTPEESAPDDYSSEDQIPRDQGGAEMQSARLQSGEPFDGEEEFAEADDDDTEPIIYDADAEDRAEELAFRARMEAGMKADEGNDSLIAAPEGEEVEGDIPSAVSNIAEMMAVIESLIFVSEEPLQVRAIAEVLQEDRGWVEMAVEELAKEFNGRDGGIWLREVAGGWQFATRPEHHEYIRAFLRSRPSAKLSLAALETLAVIAYKQPITVPEILEIRGVQSSSAIKTLLDKRLVRVCGRKETVGRPMMYGTSKEFLLQFGLKDLSELPSFEDFEDLTASVA
jgi:segregation and condensation protein B